MTKQNIENLTNPSPNVEVLTPQECKLLYDALAYHWIDRGSNYEETKALVDRLYRRATGLALKD